MATGQVLWAHHPLKRLPIASLTKIMTAILVTERTRPNEKALVTHGLYWAPVTSEDEADYLCAILNAPATTDLTRPLMSPRRWPISR